VESWAAWLSFVVASLKQGRPPWVLSIVTRCGGVSGKETTLGGSLSSSRRGGVSQQRDGRVGLWVTELSVVASLKQGRPRWVFEPHPQSSLRCATHTER
jgi:hypothetical protein